jgi:23S rRNA (guanosine2251-2'-O)-methyltransferase
MKLNARELRMTSPDAQFAKQIKRNPIFIVLDNVLDTYNVGAIFRLADAVAAQKVYLCGATETPPNSKIKKASINTWAWVEWEYCSTAKYAVEQCRMQPCLPAGRNAECRIVAVEQDKRSVPFYKAEYQMPLALVVGNETTGVSKDILEVADTIVELPMWGVNKSLNVMVSCSIVLYEIMKQTLRV